MNFRKFLVCSAILIQLMALKAVAVTKEERLRGIPIKPDSQSYDKRTLENGFDDCIMDRNGELFVIGMIRPNDVLIDVGANIGDWSLRAFHQEPNISACCFEPIPLLHPILTKHLHGKPALISYLALSDIAGKATFVYYPNNPHLSSLHRRSEDDEKRHGIEPVYFEVNLERLDTFCERYKVPKANIIKIDVEGNEYNVMLGAERLLQKGLVDVIQFEYAWTFQHSNTRLKDVFEYLTKYGFTLYRLTPHCLIEICEWRDALENYYFCNYVAIRN